MSTRQVEQGVAHIVSSVSGVLISPLGLSRCLNPSLDSSNCFIFHKESKFLFSKFHLGDKILRMKNSSKYLLTQHREAGFSDG